MENEENNSNSQLLFIFLVISRGQGSMLAHTRVSMRAWSYLLPRVCVCVVVLAHTHRRRMEHAIFMARSRQNDSRVAPFCLLSIYKHRILQMLQAGLTEYWKRMYWPNEAAKKKCGAHQPNSSQHEAKRRLRLIDLQSAFLVLAVGFVIAFSAFVSEICFHLIRQCL